MRAGFRPDLRPMLAAAIRFTIDARSERWGVAAIDYALLAGMIAMAAVGSLYVVGGAVHNMYDMVSTVFVQSLSP